MEKVVKDRYVSSPSALPTPNMNSRAPHSQKIAAEAQHGLIAQVLKDVIFSMRPRSDNAAIASAVSTATDTAMAT